MDFPDGVLDAFQVLLDLRYYVVPDVEALMAGNARRKVSSISASTLVTTLPSGLFPAFTLSSDPVTLKVV